MAASALLLRSAYKASVFSQIKPVPPYFFHLKNFLWKVALTVKVRNNHRSDFGLHQFCIEIRAHLGHLFAKTPIVNKFDE